MEKEGVDTMNEAEDEEGAEANATHRDGENRRGFSRDQKEIMSPYLTIFLVLLVGFTVYFLFRDFVFEPSEETFGPSNATDRPAPASIEIRQGPLYPPRQVAASGPHPPSQASEDDVHLYAPPAPVDPYSETQENSEIPEHLRHPERSFRPPPLNDQTGMAVQSGIASQTHQVSSDASQGFQQEMIQGGGEFMPGIFANDITNDASYSAF